MKIVVGKALTLMLSGALAVGGVSLYPQGMYTRARGEPVADFYANKTVILIVGYSAGGGFDLYARLLARHLPRHLPGHPTLIVQNMPGAGSLVAANHLYNAAPRDGTTLGTFSASLVLRQLVGDPAVRFDGSRFNWIGSANAETGVIIARTDAPARSFDESFAVPVRLGTLGPGSEGYQIPLFLNGMLGTKFDIIAGYPGSNELDLALERGEVHGRFQLWSSIKARRPEWVDPNKPFVNVLVQIGSGRNPDLPNVPLVMDYVRSEALRGLFEVFFVGLTMGRPFAAPPGVPGERIDALRRAFWATLNDPRFRAEAEVAKLSLDGALPGEVVQQLVERIMSAPPEQVGVLTEYLGVSRSR